ncbi:MAG: signal peptidase I [Actinomycetota bacterium]
MRRLLEWLATLAVAAVVVLVFEAEVAKPYRIPSSSMEPTLHCAKPGDECEGSFNDRVIADRLSYVFGSPKRGQIVVFKAPAAASVCGSNDGGSTFVKRLIGLPGDTVAERSGVVYVDGRKLVEPYIDPRMRDGFTKSYGRVPAGHYFFMGDNRAFSCDSRTWGSVPRSSLIGRVLLTYFPFSRLGFH